MHRHRRPLFYVPILLLLATALAAQSPFAGPPTLPEDRAAGAAAVSLDDCRNWLGRLASPEFEGRQTGQPGYQKAADYVAARFRELGLEARGEGGSYFQHVPWGSAKIDAASTFLSFRRGDQELLRVPAERLAGSASAPVSATGPVVLLVVEAPAVPEGRRFEAPPIPGLGEVEVAGKVVVVCVKARAGERTSAALARFAVLQAMAGKQPAAVLFATTEAPAGGLRARSGAGRRAGNAAVAWRQPHDVTFGGDDLLAMLRAGGADPEVLQGTVLAPAITLDAQVEIAVREQQAPAMNVWAALPGSDPARRDEYVVIGSHLDHVGMRGGLHPGADDDASGTTGVLAAAKMFTKGTVRPARSILFVCFCGEEDGLFGSGFFTDNSPVPLASMVAMLQLDMIGRDEEDNHGEKAEDNRKSLHLVGSQRLAPALHELCLQKNAAAGFDIEYDQEGMWGGSDHVNFARHGVPVVFFFTGLHRDYHRATDTPDRIHYEKLLRVATYVFDVAFELAIQPGRPGIDPELWQKLRGKAREQPAAPLLPAPAAAGEPQRGGG